MNIFRIKCVSDFSSFSVKKKKKLRMGFPSRFLKQKQKRFQNQRNLSNHGSGAA